MRRKENDRIERENHAFAKRLFQNAGSISKHKLDLQYQENLALKNRIRRVKKPLPGVNGRASLPPLESVKSSRRMYATKKSQSVLRSEDPAVMTYNEEAKGF